VPQIAAAASSAEDVSRYASWIADLAGRLPPGARVVDLGCGAGLPASRELARHGLQVLGVDFSAVQLRRARQLVPAAQFVQADMTAFGLRSASVDAVVSFYALIHVPLAEQQALFPRVREWIRPGGYFLAIVGAGRWTGTERYRRRYVLGSRGHRHVPALAVSCSAHTDLEPLRPRG
jgi:cyclopropane fatty-acyl-phospholipid synthase-like methyltransferase